MLFPGMDPLMKSPLYLLKTRLKGIETFFHEACCWPVTPGRNHLNICECCRSILHECTWKCSLHTLLLASALRCTKRETQDRCFPLSYLQPQYSPKKTTFDTYCKRFLVACSLFFLCSLLGTANLSVSQTELAHIGVRVALPCGDCVGKRVLSWMLPPKRSGTDSSCCLFLERVPSILLAGRRGWGFWSPVCSVRWVPGFQCSGGLTLQLDCWSATRTRIINLPTNQKGYDTFETTVRKLSVRRIELDLVKFCTNVIFFGKILHLFDILRWLESSREFDFIIIYKRMICSCLEKSEKHYERLNISFFLSISNLY